MDKLLIETVEVPDDVEVSYIDEVIELNSGGGMFADSHIAKYNFYPIDGIALAVSAKSR